METNDKKDRRDDIFSRSVRAGRRTYFFDVKATRADDYYLTITESTKRFNDDGTFYYEKHRLFLYKEDFQKYKDCLVEVTKYIIDKKGEAPARGEGGYKGNVASNSSNVATSSPPAVEAAPNNGAEEASIVTEKTEEEVGLVEDAHEKAIAEGSSGENGVDSSVEASNGQVEETLESANPIKIESNTETKTE